MSDQDAMLLLENQLCFPLYAAARMVTSLYTPYFKPLGLTYTQYIVLLVLWQQKTATVGDLCKKLYLDNGTMTPLLKKLEERGLINRARSEQDERVVTITVTDAGWALKEQAKTIPPQVGACIRLAPEEAVTLHSLLYKLLETL